MNAYSEISWEKTSNNSHKYIAAKWKLLNGKVDMFFSNTNYNSKENSSSISLYSITFLKEGKKLQNDFEFQYKMDLPQTTKHLKLTVEKDQDEIENAMSDENISTSKNRSKKISKNTKTNYSAGVNYLVNSSKGFSSMLKFGLRIDMPLNPSLKYKLEKEIEFKYLNVNLSQDLILYRQEGFSEISSLTFSREWTETVKTDLSNNLAWTDENDFFLLRNNFLIYKDLGDERTLTYSLGANARLSPKYYYESYDTSISYRRKLLSNWIYGAFSIGAEFLKEKKFTMDNFVQLRFEVFFK